MTEYLVEPYETIPKGAFAIQWDGTLEGAKFIAAWYEATIPRGGETFRSNEKTTITQEIKGDTVEIFLRLARGPMVRKDYWIVLQFKDSNDRRPFFQTWDDETFQKEFRKVSPRW